MPPFEYIGSVDAKSSPRNRVQLLVARIFQALYEWPGIDNCQGVTVKEQDSRIENTHQLILYVEKEDHTYGPVQTGSYMVENYLDDFFDKKEKLRQKRLQELLAGEISPLAYYKDLVDIGEGDLACRVGVSRRKLRFHMTPKGFSRITVAQLERYATIFGIPVAQLFQIVLCDDTQVTISNGPTGLPVVIISRITAKGEPDAA